MKTPIHDFIQNYIKSNPIRFHMPGHKGMEGKERDITEIDGADYLNLPTGIILESEEEASKLFGSKSTVYSVGGSSTCIKAMCHLLVTLYNGERIKILASRNSHKAFIDASIVLGFDIEWIEMNSYSNILSCDICYDKLEKQLEGVQGVYLTSPDYLGNILDIERICKLAREKGVVSLVDNAHGSYLKFLEKDIHPISLGADLCCDSSHKTLSALTGGAYLHIGKNAPSMFVEMVKSSMSLFSTTSPSYLIMESLDLCNLYIETISEKLSKTIRKIEEVKNSLRNIGYTILKSDPLRITIDTKEYGYLGNEIKDILKENGIFIEYYDCDFIVLMATTFNKEEDFEKLYSVLSKIEKRERLEKLSIDFLTPKKAISTRDATYMKNEEIDIIDSLGRICGYENVLCPPAVLICCPGEIIDDKVIKVLKYYGRDKIHVVV